MKTKLICTCGIATAVSLLLISCTTSQPTTVASVRRNRMPPAQNVHTSSGGNIILDLQQRGGQGVQTGPSNAIGSVGGGH